MRLPAWLRKIQCFFGFHKWKHWRHVPENPADGDGYFVRYCKVCMKRETKDV